MTINSFTLFPLLVAGLVYHHSVSNRNTIEANWSFYRIEVVPFEQSEHPLESLMAFLPSCHSGSRSENEAVLHCYYKANPSERGCRARMYEL